MPTTDNGAPAAAPRIVAIHASPRRAGNTSTLLDQAVAGARAGGAEVTEIVLRELNISPCLELYGCKKDGRCIIADDFQQIYDLMLASQGLMLAAPIFFYALSAQAKILMDRCQSLWVKKYWIDKQPFGGGTKTRKGLFISVGATTGSRLFEGALLSVKYFFDVLDMELWQSLLYRGLDFEGDVLATPEYLTEAHQAGSALAARLL
ncbi:MAG: flavodoxin family protein [Pseudomonadota bacterium]